MLNHKIEVGKYYIDQSGAVWKIVISRRSEEQFIGEVIKNSKEVHGAHYSGSWFNSYGQFGRGYYEDYEIADLIAEYKPLKIVLPLP